MQMAQTGLDLARAHCATICRFYDQEWNFRSTKHESIHVVSRSSRIDVEVLDGHRALQNVAVARRMSWASMRETTRLEDIAYCLMGIFDIHMPMIYGEGAKAWFRLQEEIAKQSCDHSLFAWTQGDTKDSGVGDRYRGLFANEFRECGDFAPRVSSRLLDMEFNVTNKGLRIENSPFCVPLAD